MSLPLARTPPRCTLTLRTARDLADEDGFRGTDVLMIAVPCEPRSPSHRRPSYRAELIPPEPAPDVDLGRGAPIVAWPCSVGHPDSSGMESGVFRGNAEGVWEAWRYCLRTLRL